jgi:hypothetical protein
MRAVRQGCTQPGRLDFVPWLVIFVVLQCGTSCQLSGAKGFEVAPGYFENFRIPIITNT